MKRLIATLLVSFATHLAAQTVTTQYTAKLTESGDDPPFVATIPDATEPAEPLTPALHVAAPNAQAPRLIGFVQPAIAIPFNSNIRQLEAFWNGTPLPLIDPFRTGLAEEAHAWGPMLPFFKPLFSLQGIAPGSGTMEIRAYDASHNLVTSVSIPQLTVVAAPAPVATSTVAAIPHPRIWLTPSRLQTIAARGANDIPRLRFESGVQYFMSALDEIPDVTSPAFESRVYDPESYIPLLALTYELKKNSDPAFATRAAGAAKTLALRMAREYDNGTRDFGRDTGYDIRFGLRNLMLAYDWMYDRFSADERALIVRVATNWVDWYHETPGYAESWPVENYYAGYIQGIALTAVATAGDNANADRIFTLLRTKLGTEMPLLDQRLAGGDWAEGWNYGWYATNELVLVDTLLRDLGEDWSAIFDFVQPLARSMTYQAAPDFSETRPYGGYSGDYPHRTSAATLAVLSSNTTDGPLAARLYASILANANNDVTDLRSDAFYDMIFASPNAGDVSGLPLSYFNSGTGRFFSRSSLTDPNAYFVSTENTSYSYDHYGYANGDVRLYHGDTCLVCPSAYRGEQFQGEAGTPAFSTYIVNGSEQQLVLGRNNQNLFTVESGRFAAIGMRFESSYAANRYDEGNLDPSNAIDYIIREVVHVRPSTVVVRDLHRRRHASDTLTGFFHLGPSGPVQTIAAGQYRIGALNVSTFYPSLATAAFSTDVDGGNTPIGTLLRVDFASSTQPVEIVTVFSDTLSATSYISGVVTLSDGTRVTFANGTVTVSGASHRRRGIRR